MDASTWTRAPPPDASSALLTLYEEGFNVASDSPGCVIARLDHPAIQPFVEYVSTKANVVAETWTALPGRPQSWDSARWIEESARGGAKFLSKM